MHVWLLILEWVALGLLTGFLWLKQHQRNVRRPQEFDPTRWTGKSMDVSQLSPGLENARQICRTAHLKAKGVCFHRALLAVARRSVTRFAYFENRDSVNEVHS